MTQRCPVVVQRVQGHWAGLGDTHAGSPLQRASSRDTVQDQGLRQGQASVLSGPGELGKPPGNLFQGGTKLKPR